MNKTEIRNSILKKRDALSAKEVCEYSAEIFKKLETLKCFKDSNILMLYVSKGNEVSTSSIICYALENKKKICVPKVDTARHHLDPIFINDPSCELSEGTFGIKEPCFCAEKIVALKDIGVIITPGIAFDESGHRLGWGKGYYDEFLEHAEDVPKVGLAYDFQIVSRLPADKHDIPMDLVVTEKRIIRVRS